MLKRFGLAAMLFATLAVAPLTIAAQERNTRAIPERTRGNVVMQYDRGDRQDRGRDMRDRDRDRNRDNDRRGYAEQRDWNR